MLYSKERQVGNSCLVHAKHGSPTTVDRQYERVCMHCWSQL